MYITYIDKPPVGGEWEPEKMSVCGHKESDVNISKSCSGKIIKSIYTRAKLGMFRKTDMDPK